MDTKKKIIILAIILTIIIVIISSVLLLNKDKDENSGYGNIATPAIENDSIEIEEKLKEVTVRNNYYAVKSCITKFYTYYNELYNVDDSILIMDEEAEASIENEKKLNLEAIYNMLDNEYKKYKNITKDNLTTKLSNISVNTVDITNMYVSQKNENISIYFAEGYLIDTESSKATKFKIMLKIDMINRTFTVLLEDYIKEKYQNIKIDENIEINYLEEIEKNAYNIFDYQSITDDEHIIEVFDMFKYNMIYLKDEMYENLEDTYKKLRFPKYTEFEEYAKNNIRELFIMKLSKYMKTDYADYTQYVCLANNNKYYIINEYSPTKYEFILDTYTIDLPEFIEKYNSSNEQEKVEMNIEKIISALNEKDYKYIYTKLDETFNKNNFGSLSNFTRHIQNNLYVNNSIKYVESKVQGDTYIYKFKVNNEDGKSTEKELTIIMRLEEGTDFVMSFNIK